VLTFDPRSSTFDGDNLVITYLDEKGAETTIPLSFKKSLDPKNAVVVKVPAKSFSYKFSPAPQLDNKHVHVQVRSKISFLPWLLNLLSFLVRPLQHVRARHSLQVPLL